MPKETIEEMLNRASREIAQLASGDLIVRSRVVWKGEMGILKIEYFRRVDDPAESPSQRSDGAPHNID